MSGGAITSMVAALLCDAPQPEARVNKAVTAATAAVTVRFVMMIPLYIFRVKSSARKCVSSVAGALCGGE